MDILLRCPFPFIDLSTPMHEWMLGEIMGIEWYFFYVVLLYYCFVHSHVWVDMGCEMGNWVVIDDWLNNLLRCPFRIVIFPQLQLHKDNHNPHQQLQVDSRRYIVKISLWNQSLQAKTINMVIWIFPTFKALRYLMSAYLWKYPLEWYTPNILPIIHI